ncbi:TPA: hypothetical protein ACXN34_003978 [Burkholderia cepacia]|uniref:hypothetical protein n=1 Tax=Burkholderia cepacia TaxID=292 RepID=UPI000F5AF194|nr:hypothetical protein [Burkholderia cepacia]RQT53811.1 hypothetical protein DF043_27850 [Burkholderia cepacia]
MLANLKQLHDGIVAGLRERLPDLERIHAYPKIGKSIDTPFIAIELTELEPGHDDGTGRVPLIARMQARVIVDPLVDDAEVQVRELSARVLQTVHGATWGLPMTPGKQVGSAGEDPFRPELDTYLVWLVEWVHEFDLGDACEPPTKGRAVLWGVDPETGPGHEDHYWNPAEQGAG